jgi:(p)ppGpp synthase/HD superfamily hydrolase
MMACGAEIFECGGECGVETKEKKFSKPGASTTRRDAEFFERFAELEYLETKFHEFMGRYKFPKPEKFLMRKALDFARLAHNGQKREEGVPYITHPIRVANILMDELAAMRCDVVCTALLHDVIEDCGITLKELKNNFNDNVAQMVKLLTKDPSMENHKRIYFEGILAANGDVKLIKISDRLDNLRSLRLVNNKAKIRRYIRETEKKYMPLAEACSNYIFREMKHEISFLKNRLRR